MFGLLKRKNYTKQLPEIPLRQNDIMKGLMYLQPVSGNKKGDNRELVPGKVCGEWICTDTGIPAKTGKGNRTCPEGDLVLTNREAPVKEPIDKAKLIH